MIESVRLSARLALCASAVALACVTPRDAKAQDVQQTNVPMPAAAPTTSSPEEVHPSDTPKKLSFHDLTHDPQDGKLDLSRWLLEHKGGFLPVPIVVSDPAVGYGGGLALTFFHKPKNAASTRKTKDGKDQLIPPNMFGIMAMKTENGSNAYGAGAFLHSHDDRWRYAGGVAKASFNLDFYTPGTFGEPLALGYNAKGIASMQRVSRRFDNELLLGLTWIYMDLDLAFENPSDADRFTPKERAQRSSGLGLQLTYDQRDNPFTPNRGWTGQIQGNAYAKAFGSDVDFQSYRGNIYAYLPFADDTFILGGRVDLRWANGDVPFYRLPYIDLRGVGSGHYSDTRAAMLETELRYNVTPRWALIGFVGAGRAWGQRTSFSEGNDATSRGIGFRYKLVRALGMYAGLDYARGPDGDGTVYVQMGSAWH